MYLYDNTFSKLSGLLALKIKRLVVPSNVEEGKNVILKCEYELEGKELYSLRWLKGDLEFYRYSPDSYQPIAIFDTKGIQVDVRIHFLL